VISLPAKLTVRSSNRRKIATIKTRRPELGGLTRNVFISLFVSLSENKFATHPINLISGLIRRAEASMYPFAATFEES
jgi:hypothetical protein